LIRPNTKPFEEALETGVPVLYMKDNKLYKAQKGKRTRIIKKYEKNLKGVLPRKFSIT